MTDTNSNLRKAAVLIRSLDSDTAAMMLCQLSPVEAAAIRAAMRDLSSIEPEEQAEIAAEFRRTRPAVERAASGVELALSTPDVGVAHHEPARSAETIVANECRFEFVAHASTSALVTFLGREHPQTIAVVLAHLTPERAAAVLGELPEKLQSDTIERLAVLGEADAESVVVLERELASWFATRGADRGVLAQRRESVANILAATDAKTRRRILNKLRTHNLALASQLAGDERGAVSFEDSSPASTSTALRGRWQRVGRAERTAMTQKYASEQASDTSAKIQRGLAALKQSIACEAHQAPSAPSLPRIEFDQLVHLDAAAWAAVLRAVDANVLAVALVGSHEDLVDRVCQQMPQLTARTFRRELHHIGPVRLSDMEMAQRLVADAAARHLVERRHNLAPAH